MNILTTYFTANHLFTFVREGMIHAEFNSVTLFTVLYLQFLNCAKDVSKVTAQPTSLELLLTDNRMGCNKCYEMNCTSSTAMTLPMAKPFNMCIM